MWRSWLAHHVRDVGVGRSSRLIPTRVKKKDDGFDAVIFFCFTYSRYFLFLAFAVSSLFFIILRSYINGVLINTDE